MAKYESKKAAAERLEREKRIRRSQDVRLVTDSVIKPLIIVGLLAAAIWWKTSQDENDVGVIY